MRKIAFILLTCYSFITLYGQDLHFTNNRFAPIQFNPASIGTFKGNLRAGGIYRSQFSNFIQHPYDSYLAYGDINLNLGFRKQDWIAVGFQLFGDKAGDIGLTNNGVIGGASYHFSFDKNYKNVLTLGLSYTVNVRTFDINKAQFPDVLRTGKQGNDFTALSDFKASSKDFNVGLHYAGKIQKNSFFNLGIALLYLKGNKFNGVKANSNGQRINAHMNFGLMLPNKKTMLEPAAFMSINGQNNNLSLQLLAHQALRLKNDKDLNVNFGLGYRIDDALQILTGARYNSWNISLAYDLTVSQAKEFNNSNGALELALYKIFVFNKKPKLKPVIFCPRL